MTYTNHIILRGLDEARAHQRGEDVGLSPQNRTLPKDPLDKRKPRTVFIRPTDEKTSARYHKADTTRLAIAMAPGTPTELAAAYGVKVSAVNRMRAMWLEGKLMLGGQPVPVPDPEDVPFRTFKKGPRLDAATKRAIIETEGKPAAVAELFGVRPEQVVRLRKLHKRGQL